MVTDSLLRLLSLLKISSGLVSLHTRLVFSMLDTVSGILSCHLHGDLSALKRISHPDPLAFNFSKADKRRTVL